MAIDPRRKWQPVWGVPRPSDWIAALHHGDLGLVASTYFEMFEGRSPMLAAGGQAALATIIGIVMVILIFAFENKAEARHYTARFGKARWATRSERSRLERGLEIGVDGESGKPLRVAVEGNLLTIAPPRTGKTAAFSCQISPILITAPGTDRRPLSIPRTTPAARPSNGARPLAAPYVVST